MPGVVMDNASVDGPKQAPGSYELKNGFPSPYDGADKAGSSDMRNGSSYANGISGDISDSKQGLEVSGVLSQPPPELLHITQGFFPFSQLINRSAQQCWNDLSDLITELAEIQISSQDQSSAVSANGKSVGNQTSENVQKKLRMLDFAHAKRGEFIKLLVLSQWSRQAADVSRLIDLQNFIRTCHQAYGGALQWVGDMKRDLVRAQVANPDLKTALEVLSKGKVVAMSDLGYKPPKPLTAKRTLKKLQKLNKIISVRLALHDQVPRAFQTYRVHDGRVTFSVPGEFELDLSVGEENSNSQFFFVDIRFMFSPSSSIPKGRVLNELDIRVNDVLRDSGLTGCFSLLHNLVLTNKVNILYRQAADLARGLWSDVLRVELLHRTLIVQYWALKPGVKSWIEVGIKSGRRNAGSSKAYNTGLPYLSLRWMRDGKEVEGADIEFDTDCLSMESVLRNVIAQHVSCIISSVYTKICKESLFSTGALSLRAQLSRSEPGDCQLNVQLTTARHLSATIEPMSGASVLSATPIILDRSDSDRVSDKSPSDDIVSRIARIRCFSAIEEIESNMRMLGFETVNPRSLKFDARKVFPSNVIRFSFFWHPLWERNWIMAATSSMEGDNWWVLQLRPTMPTEKLSSFGSQNASMLRSAQVIGSEFFTAQQKANYASFADLGHCLTGTLAIYANARSLAESQCFDSYPPQHKLQIESGFRAPDIYVRYETSSLPPALQVSPPLKLKKPYINDTVRLAFHGVDPCKKLAIIVAYGSLSIPVKSLVPLVSKRDRSLAFRLKGNGFAIRFLAPAGQAVITDLIESLQKLERILFIAESLQRKKMEVRSMSLSRITFVYGPGKDLTANINVNVSGPLPSADIDLVGATSKSDGLFTLRLGITFDYPNPHRRVQESLTSSLNSASTDASLDSLFGLLLLTLPLLRAFDRITANSTRNEPLKAQIIARNAKTFLIHYPGANFRFQVVAGQHSNRMTWILRTVSGTENRPPQDPLLNKVQEKLYKSKGDGWKGLGNGAVAEADKVLNLILELDGCFSGIQSNPIVTNPPSKPENETSNNNRSSSNNQEQTIRQSGLEQAQKASVPSSVTSSAARNLGGNHEQKTDDIIMID